ncbi:unnamed protein product [Phaedon cochleariae]|uniref:Protein kinase domain-containing protein n=1 Tax=Phaedon cochleariae TaxID=80249 RepID=A0A9P0DP44_PHACE|nr:unnamed protein product [Phaedon cochleariae]
MNTFQSKYKVLDKLGEGSFSEVLKCEHRGTKKLYAAKILKKPYKTEGNITTCAEIIAAQKVSYHQNILNMLEYHYDSFGGRVTFIFELMDMSMYDFMKTKRRGLSEHRVRSYLYQILMGLDHLHKNGLFHRDVKPENILIKFPSILYAPLSQTNPNEVIKLADLGSVRGIFSSPPYTEYISTRWYRSPECLLTIGNYGPKMDIWSAGCVFYEMLTLKPLFPGSNEIDQLYRIHQLLGPPSIQYLTKLKSKSRNCVFFPKIKGTGIDCLLPHITRNGKNILSLMIEYDWEKRINVKRLLRQCYFDEIRYDVEDMSKIQHANEGIKRCMGDDTSISPSRDIIRKKILKTKEYFSDETQKNSWKLKFDRCDGDARNSKKSNEKMKNEHHIKHGAGGHYKPTGQNLSKHEVTTLPLVEYKVRSLSGECSVSNDFVDIRSRRYRHVKKDKLATFMKATSNVESVNRCSMDVPVSKKRFHSKSVVFP